MNSSATNDGKKIGGDKNIGEAGIDRGHIVDGKKIDTITDERPNGDTSSTS